MGTLSEMDKHYLAQNLLGFFRRDYFRVALAHVESGWAPPSTPLDEFESAIRAVCEPVFDRPLKEISFGRVLLRLFQTSRRFNIEVQPQLVLLQKTLLNIEGLGRQLDPDLDLWATAKPYIERWMSEQIGWRGLVRRLRDEAPNWAIALPKLPRLVEQALAHQATAPSADLTVAILAERRRTNRLLILIAFMPTRIASNVDVLANSIGGLIGALAAPLFSPTRLLGSRLARLRREWFVYGASADVGVVLVCLWVATQLHPTVQLFGTGNLRSTFDLPVWLIHRPPLLLTAEAAVAAFNVLGLGLIVLALTRKTKPRGVALAVLLAAALIAKGLSAIAIVKSNGPLTWFTPGVAVGLLAGGIALYILSSAPRRTQWVVAAICLAAAITAANIGPDNPYQVVPAHFLAGPRHFLNFSSIIRAMSELWPFLGVVYAGIAAFEQPK